MIFTHARPIVEAAELFAANGDSKRALATLRELCLYDFGLLMLSMPDAGLPALTAMLPRVAAREVEQQWAGEHGFDLFRKTADFCSRLQNYMTASGRVLIAGATIMDFGCGFGRMTRMLPWFTDPANIFAIDPWERSIEICKQDGLLGNLRISSYLPEELPLDERQLDLSIAFSVFTHTSLRATKTALNAIRASTCLGGLLVLTVRPVEFWNESFHEKRPNFNRDAVQAAYRDTGFSYLGNGFAVIDGDDVYGEATIDPEWFVKNRKDWRLVGYDRGIDLMQTILVLKAV